MEIILIVLTSAIISCMLMASYRIGYSDGEKSQKDGFTLTDRNRSVLKQYANFVTYDGSERGDE